MQSPPASNTSRRVPVGLPRNPREGRLLKQSSQPALTRQTTQAEGSVWDDPAGPEQRRFAARSPPPSLPRHVTQEVARVGVSSSPRPHQRWQSVTSASSSSSSVTSSQVISEKAHTRAVSQDRTGSAMPAEQGQPALWRTVASLANNLTINVGIAWSSTVTTNEGEDTPLGAESRLTRAMKAYHLSKAQDLSDLPEWLFTEKERRSRPVVVQGNQSYRNDLDERPASQPPRPDRIPTSSNDSRSRGVEPASRPARGTAATDRLKALRARERQLKAI
ncbi:hypothetical protein CC1G_04281 [Coprinopsis cinerea okayama7|uniref:Uncharacterized protein n=1 Tax=Coprinopsis cinerea (strain Okayama-7 / 130 / ATCC MYA-4618 / FGSC 9003) TaxID=240176 RepID=A8NFJ7_COPC7|nr:hypothetical protein CC1G_04281 [Coprinopsis cinerea okayama7\|eukprot:XP_001833302.2 hypothetical protein CC1G_04281 [Coprinopsis cinerea okayama7\